MSGLAFHQTEFSGRNTGTSVSLPDDNIGRLMYYLNCVNSVLAGSPFPSDVTNHANYRRVDKETKKHIVLLAAIFNPSELVGKVFHQVPADHPLLKGYGNTFIELTAASRQFVITQSFVVGDQRVQTAKIMLFTTTWIANNWQNPFMASKSLLPKKKKTCTIQ